MFRVLSAGAFLFLAGGLGLQYLWLGDDYKQLSLSLRAFF